MSSDLIYLCFLAFTVDTGNNIELDEHKGHVQPSSLTEGVSVKSIGDVKTTESNSKEEYVNGEDSSIH